MQKHARYSWLMALSAFSLTTQAAAQSKYTGPKAVVYIGDNWCYGGYCGWGTTATFESALNQALVGSGYILAVRKPEGANLNMRAGVTGYSSSGGLCLPIIGCVNGKTVNGTLELSDAKSGSVVYTDTCQGTSAGYSSWWYWTGSVNFSSDDDKAAADCAAKLVQKLTASATLKSYLTYTPGTPINVAPAPAPTPAPVPTPTPAAQTQASTPVQMLGTALKTLAFADMNALFTSDPYNPVKVKELNAAASSASLIAAAKVKFSVTPGENAGTYQLVGLTYTLPDGKEKYLQLAVTSDPALNTRGGSKILYLSAYNPLRSGNTALDGLSKNVETLLNDLNAALGLPGL